LLTSVALVLPIGEASEDVRTARTAERPTGYFKQDRRVVDDIPLDYGNFFLESVITQGVQLILKPSPSLNDLSLLTALTTITLQGHAGAGASPLQNLSEIVTSCNNFPGLFTQSHLSSS